VSQPTRTHLQHPGSRPVSLLPRTRRPVAAAVILVAATTLGTAVPSVAHYPGSGSDTEQSSGAAATAPATSTDTVLAVAVDDQVIAGTITRRWEDHAIPRAVTIGTLNKLKAQTQT
jgi:hypothetical protein